MSFFRRTMTPEQETAWLTEMQRPSEKIVCRECGGPVKGRGLCGKHYQIARRSGFPDEAGNVRMGAHLNIEEAGDALTSRPLAPAIRGR